MLSYEFVNKLSNSIELNEKVVSSLTDILTSTKSKTVIENIPVQQSEYFHQKGSSYLYEDRREPLSSDMFDGEAGVHKAPKPILKNFDLGETPDVLNDKLGNKIKTLTSINETTSLVLHTLSSTLDAYNSTIKESIRRDGSKVWKPFVVGEYWPLGDGFSDNADNCSTHKVSSVLLQHKDSKYSFIKLRPSVDAKHHFMRIYLSELTDISTPCIFIILDTISARDGDKFEFKIEFVLPDDYTNETKLPELMFFDGSYNSNSVPQPSYVVDYSLQAKHSNISIKLEGNDYFYVGYDNLPESVREDLEVGDSVLVKANEMNNNIINHHGVLDRISLASLYCSKYNNYGVLNNGVMKVYRNDNIFLTCEQMYIDYVTYSGSHTKHSLENMSHRLLINNTLKYVNGFLRIDNPMNSYTCYGRPASFCKPVFNDKYWEYTYPQPTSLKLNFDMTEGSDTNGTRQFNLDKFPSYMTSENENGIIFEYDIDSLDFNICSAIINLGIFETSLGIKITIDSIADFSDTTRLRVSHEKFNNSNTPVLVGEILTDTRKFKCISGFIYIKGILYSHFVLKTDNTILYDSGLIKSSNGKYTDTLLFNKSISDTNEISVNKLSPEIANYLSESKIYTYWYPALTMLIDSDKMYRNTSSIKISDISVNHSLTKEQFDATIKLKSKLVPFVEDDIEYLYPYETPRGLIPFTYMKVEDVKGFLCKVRPKCVNQYHSNKAQNSEIIKPSGIIPFRVGFTYCAYKGDVYATSHVEQSNTLQWYETTEVEAGYSEDTIVPRIIDDARESDTTNLDNMAIIISADEPSNIIEFTPTNEVLQSPTVSKISHKDTKQIDNILASYGWKVTTYYQSMGA